MSFVPMLPVFTLKGSSEAEERLVYVGGFLLQVVVNTGLSVPFMFCMNAGEKLIWA